MVSNLAIWDVDVTFVATPPARAMVRASGVSEVRVYGHRLKCVVSGTFQPFLEALRGSEVIGLTSIPVIEAPVRTEEAASA